MRYVALACRLLRLLRWRLSGVGVTVSVGLVLIAAGVIGGVVVAREHVYAALSVIAVAVLHHWPVAVIALGALVVGGAKFRRELDRRTNQRTRTGLLVLVGVVVVLGVFALLFGPVTDWAAGPHVAQLHGKDRADAENAVRQTLLAAAGGLAAVVGLTISGRTFYLSRRGQVTDRYAKAVALLASDKMAERVGAVYALEHVMRESAVDHDTVVNLLAAFVRERAPAAVRPAAVGPVGADAPMQGKRELPPTDVQTALTVLARRPDRTERQPLDLSRTDLGRANLTDAKLTGAVLTRALLTGAVLTGAVLADAELTGAVLTGAVLADAKLAGAGLAGADLAGADLSGANLTDAYLSGATLRGAFLLHADLSGAHLLQADLSGANLSGATLRGAFLLQADLSGANLHEANLTGARLFITNLIDADLTRANLTGVDLTAVNLTGAVLRAADLTDAVLTRVLRPGLVLSGAGLSRADLSDAVLTRAIFDATQVPESAFDAPTDGQDGKAEQGRTEEPQRDLDGPSPEGEGHGLGGTEQ
jgi:uncharacterized protein YjbI with pentapeptide repeats